MSKKEKKINFKVSNADFDIIKSKIELKKYSENQKNLKLKDDIKAMLKRI